MTKAIAEKPAINGKKISPDSLDRSTSQQEYGILLPYYYLGDVIEFACFDSKLQ